MPGADRRVYQVCAMGGREGYVFRLV